MSDFHYDCIVIGLGAMGSATAYHLARRGVRVLGLEQHALGHSLGSSHGRSRVFRTTYIDPLYAQLSQEAERLWRDLESASGRTLLRLTGLLAFAHPDNPRFVDQLAALKRHGLPHELLSAREVNSRFPAFALPKDRRAFLAERNGMLRADIALQTLREGAVANGATLRDHAQAEALETDRDGVRIRVNRKWLTARQAVVTAGPWLAKFLSELNLPLTVSREHKAYFHLQPRDRFSVGKLPVFVEYDTSIYGLPADEESGVKLAQDHSGPPFDPDDEARLVDEAALRTLEDWLPRYTTAETVARGEAAACLYTNTPDRDFVIDRHPRLPSVLLAGGFSGHGFKFSILVGDLLADLVQQGETPHLLERFRCDRFA